MPRPFRPVALTAATVLIGAGLAVAGMPDAGADDTAPPANTVQVTVNTGAVRSIVSDTALGINDAVWDSQLGTTAVSDLLHDAGVQMMRYPGGSYGDIYHWQDNTAPGGYVAPNTDFDTFMASVQRVGAQPIIIANYGTGTPQEAADWVRYANITKGYGAKYWEIGNELYGNGHYGADWEADDHADSSPTAYANGVVAYSEAMKAVDPSIKIGAVLTMPGNWPDGLIAAGDDATWNDTVLRIAGPAIDFVILHWYPTASDAAAVLKRPDQIDDMIYLVRQEIARDAGPDASRIQIALTETSSGIDMDTQPAALYAADAFSTLWEDGVFTVDWWDLHNGPSASSTVAGQTDYGDMGALSSGTCTSDGVCEPPVNTPFAPFHAIDMLHRFAGAGDTLVGAGSDSTMVKAHAALRPDGDLAVLLVNEDPATTYQVSLHYTGFSPAAGTPTVYSYGNGDTGITTTTAGSASAQTLPPYSLTTIVMHPSHAPAAGRPSAPGTPVVDSVDGGTVTLSWPPATAGDHPIVKYEVYRQNGTTSEELGETGDTTLTVRNLVPGRRYRINVVARDASGATSPASLPVTVRAGAPADSGCAVHFADTNDWGNGFVGSIDITNTSEYDIDGWTLHFVWPTGWQSVSSGWNGNWVQTGTEVTVTNVDYNAALAADGGTTNIGFVGAYDGPNVLPVAITLNGTVCSLS